MLIPNGSSWFLLWHYQINDEYGTSLMICMCKPQCSVDGIDEGSPCNHYSAAILSLYHRKKLLGITPYGLLLINSHGWLLSLIELLVDYSFLSWNFKACYSHFIYLVMSSHMFICGSCVHKESPNVLGINYLFLIHYIDSPCSFQWTLSFRECFKLWMNEGQFPVVNQVVNCPSSPKYISSSSRICKAASFAVKIRILILWPNSVCIKFTIQFSCLYNQYLGSDLSL